MNKYFTKTFFKFLLGFLAIVVAAFSLLALFANQPPKPVDNIAQPQ
jgi:hypothetical protein